MDRSIKILLLIILGIVVLNGIYNLVFSKSKLTEAIHQLSKLQKDVTAVSTNLEHSKTEIATMLQNLERNQAKIGVLKQEVDLLYLDYLKDESRSRMKRDSLAKELREGENELDSLIAILKTFEN